MIQDKSGNKHLGDLLGGDHIIVRWIDVHQRKLMALLKQVRHLTP